MNWFGVIQWLLIFVFAVSFSGNDPLLALGIGIFGGIGLGIYLWQHVKPLHIIEINPTRCCNLFSRLSTYDIFLFGPSLLFLLLANRLPYYFSFSAFLFLMLLLLERRIRTGNFFTSTPLNLPVNLLLICSLISLITTVDLHKSGSAVFMLLAGIALFYGLTNSIIVEQKIDLVFRLLLVVGVIIAFSTFFIMPFPATKLPFISRLYKHLPDLFPRTIHANYIGGSLTFFFPIAFWAFIYRYRGTVWSGMASGLIGLGLLVTQSRGALLGVGIAILLTGAYWNRWIRRALPILFVAGCLLAYLGIVDRLIDAIMEKATDGMFLKRQEEWERAIYISQDYPFTGIGMHSYPVVVDLLYPLVLSGPNARIPHAHNLYLELVVSIGFPGFVAFWTLLGAWGGMVWEFMEMLRGKLKKKNHEILGVGLFCGMFAHLLYSITDAIALGEKAGIIFWAVLGLTTVVWRLVRCGERERGLS